MGSGLQFTALRGLGKEQLWLKEFMEVPCFPLYRLLYIFPFYFQKVFELTKVTEQLRDVSIEMLPKMILAQYYNWYIIIRSACLLCLAKTHLRVTQQSIILFKYWPVPSFLRSLQSHLCNALTSQSRPSLVYSLDVHLSALSTLVACYCQIGFYALLGHRFSCQTF